MDRSTVIYLITETRTQDAIGQFVSQEQKRQVYARKQSITRNEWFDAGRNGLQPEICFVVFRYDYEGELIIEDEDGNRYGIYRTYENRSEEIELYCESKGGLVQ